MPYRPWHGPVLASLLVWSFTATATGAAQAPTPPPITSLRIDPLMLVSVQEFRRIATALGGAIYPGWNPNSVPLLLYRPGVQELLLGARRRPAGFSVFRGGSRLIGERIYARNDSTVMSVDDQNTTTTLDSAKVLVVADQYSRMRSHIRGTVLARPAAFANRWLDDWGFLESPYDQLQLMLHEAFHVYQERMAPGKQANEGAVAQYPFLNPVNNALFIIEAEVLRDALLTRDQRVQREKAAEFVAVRTARRAALDASYADYENRNEFSEGTARYVEYRFLQLGEGLAPTPQMYFQAGFTGYRGVLRSRLERRLNELVAIVAVTDDRFGNMFGAGPLRFRLYELGAAQALLLDAVAPDWKRSIFEPGVYLTDLLARATALSDARRQEYLDRAKVEYRYDSLLTGCLAFEQAGHRYVQQRVDSILHTDRTLVTVSYGEAGGIAGMAFTPFGVTPVTPRVTLYDLVPLEIHLRNGVVLHMKQIIPVLLDRDERTISFAVATPAAAFEGQGAAGIDNAEFSLGSSPPPTVTITGNRVRIGYARQ